MPLSARSYVLALLKRRLRSRAELEAALTRRRVPGEEQTALLNELAKVGLIDDLRFARQFVQARDRLNPRGWPVLQAELKQKGVSPEMIAQVKAERAERMEHDPHEQPTEEALARDLVERQRRRYQGLDETTAKRRLTAFLLRRGFTYDLVRRILDA